MKNSIAVCSRSFSKNIILRDEITAQFSDVTFNDEGLNLSGDSLIEFLKGHQKAIVALETIDFSILSKLPDLKVISKYGVGMDMLDMQALRKCGIRLGWEGGVNKRSVAELVIGFAIVLLRHLYVCNAEVRSGIFKQKAGVQLSEKTFGIIGCGNVGKDLVRLLQPFNCKILVYDIEDYQDFYSEYGIITASLEELLKLSDIVSIHIPFNEASKNLIDGGKLAFMKSNAILINTARGGIVDEGALNKSLMNGSLAGAAFDVFSPEPPSDLELLNLVNFFSTPHIGGSSIEAVLAMGRSAIKGLTKNNLV